MSDTSPNPAPGTADANSTGLPFTLAPGERVVRRFRPGAASIALRRLGGLAVAIAAGLSLTWAAMRGLLVSVGLGWSGLAVFVVSLAVVLAWLLWGRLDWEFRRYTLTTRRAVWRGGVIRRGHVEALLENVQHVVVTRSLRERLFGLGTIRLTTAGTDFVQIIWGYLQQPEVIADEVRRAIDGQSMPAPGGVGGGQAERRVRVMSRGAPSDRPALSGGQSRPAIIGLAGGIGSGKSTVAEQFGRLGCVVVDSDARAKAALDDPAVRDRLVEWWGEGVLNAPDELGRRRVDRKKVAEIIFKDGGERARLEALVHPLVRRDRASMVAEAAVAGAPAVIVDAPLLFEAGLDAECDAVVFVEAERSERLTRVSTTRGWDEAELARREAAQWPIEQKRERSGHVVVNNAAQKDLEVQVERVLAEILRLRGSR